MPENPHSIGAGGVLHVCTKAAEKRGAADLKAGKEAKRNSSKTSPLQGIDTIDRYIPIPYLIPTSHIL